MANTLSEIYKDVNDAIWGMIRNGYVRTPVVANVVATEPIKPIIVNGRHHFFANFKWGISNTQMPLDEYIDAFDFVLP